jgi:periplasmic copper chaperone A
MRIRSRNFLVASAASTAFVLVLVAGRAAAHVDPDPLAVEAGATATVGFKIEHGCDGSPTTSLQFKIPPEVSNVKPVDKPGWTTTVTGDLVTFKGGPLPADQEDHFDLTLTAPTQAGEVRFPAIQTCQKGELAWIEIPADGAAEPEHPAPTLKITAGPPSSADLTPEPESTDGGTPASTPTVVAATPPDDSGNTGVAVAAIIGGAVVVIGGGWWWTRRRQRAGRPPDA